MKRLLGLLLVAVSVPAAACTCGSWAPFLEASKAAPVIVHARVLEYDKYAPGNYPLSMLIGVIQPGRNARAGERIRVWGDPGYLCRPYVSRFPVGTEWVFALGADAMDSPRQEKPGVRELSIGGCGAYWLRVRGERALGEIRTAGKNEDMLLPRLLRRYDAR